MLGWDFPSELIQLWRYPHDDGKPYGLLGSFLNHDDPIRPAVVSTNTWGYPKLDGLVQGKSQANMDDQQGIPGIPHFWKPHMFNRTWGPNTGSTESHVQQRDFPISGFNQQQNKGIETS